MFTCLPLSILNFIYADDRTIFKACIPHESSEYYRERLSNQNIDFLRKIDIQGKLFSVIGMQGGSHLGLLYVISDDFKVLHRLETGPIYTIFTKNEMASLYENEILVITATGGTGEHHVLGLILQFIDDTVQVKSTFPMHGYSANYHYGDQYTESEMIINYNVLKQEYKENAIIMTMHYETRVNNIKGTDKNKILKYFGVDKESGIFNIIVGNNRNVVCKGPQYIIKSLQWTLNTEMPITTIKHEDKKS